jgi:ABC-type sugar transport system substrate-binding protein
MKDLPMRRNDWLFAGFDLWVLGIEAAAVITIRGMKVAAGGAAAEAEMLRMVTEKMQAGFALQALALRGGLGRTMPDLVSKTTKHYRKRVRSNRRRLTKA